MAGDVFLWKDDLLRAVFQLSVNQWIISLFQKYRFYPAKAVLLHGKSCAFDG